MWQWAATMTTVCSSANSQHLLMLTVRNSADWQHYCWLSAIVPTVTTVLIARDTDSQHWYWEWVMMLTVSSGADSQQYWLSMKELTCMHAITWEHRQALLGGHWQCTRHSATEAAICQEALHPYLWLSPCSRHPGARSASAVDTCRKHTHCQIQTTHTCSVHIMTFLLANARKYFSVSKHVFLHHIHWHNRTNSSCELVSCYWICNSNKN